MSLPKILVFDIETFPLVTESWGVYQQDALRILRDFTVAAFSAKWLGSKQIITKGLCDYRGYRPVSRNNISIDDRKIVKDIWNLVNEADVVIAHNGDRFDVKKINTRFIVHGLNPPAPFKTVDTLKTAHSVFAFDSSRLNELGRILGEGSKEHTGGFPLWVGCMEGDKDSWRKMKSYNEQDVILLENVYRRFIPWIKNHPSIAVFNDSRQCPKCGSIKLQSRGYEITRSRKYRRLQCISCGGWSRDIPNILSTKVPITI